ncbi:MAG: hypothetical protein ABF382_02925 [Akkermansiaceae bacterium]
MSCRSIRIIPPKKLGGKMVIANNALPTNPCISKIEDLTKINFDKTPRGTRKEVGASQFLPGGNPGWKILNGFKDR